MLNITHVNHIGIRISDKSRSIDFYSVLGFELIDDVGFESGHPLIMKHSSGVVLNLLGPADVPGDTNILMDVDEKHTGITHFALTVGSLAQAKEFVSEHDIQITGSFSFGNMSAIFIRDPDRNVIELDAYDPATPCVDDGYSYHP
jgi:catechol 2,3-dioxygenase-like lactoylglutathione lyase family enzyme